MNKSVSINHSMGFEIPAIWASDALVCSKKVYVQENLDLNFLFCFASMTGHSNEKNFVGLATDGDYITCGSENNSLYMYYKVWSLKLFTFGSFSGHG